MSIPYNIKDRSRRNAERYGITLIQSSNPKYKIDAYLRGVFLNSFGSNGAMDYPTYLEETSKKYADYRRELYYERHPINYPKYSRDWLSKIILWS